MSNYVGIWVDHEKAQIVFIKGEREETISIESGAEGHIRLSGGSRSKSPFGPQEVASEQKMGERRKHQLQRYYRKIAEKCRGAQGILILGPGEAKAELAKELRKSKDLASRIIGVEPADKMTKNQFRARMRKSFS